MLAVLVAAVAAAAVSVTPAYTTNAGATATDDWPTFHHDNLHSGVSPDTTIGAAHAPSLTKLWNQLVGGGSQGKAGVLASPLMAYNTALGKEVIYAVSVLGEVHAFDTAGNTVFNVDVDAPVFHGGIVDTPALYNGVLYFGTGQGTMFAVDATTGAVDCTYQLPTFAPETTPGGIQSSPAVAVVDGSGPVVYFGDIGTAEATNAGHEWAMNGVGNTNGACTIKWSFNGFLNKGAHGTQGGSWSPPAVGTDAGGTPVVLFGSSNPDDALYSLNAITGAEIWRAPTIKTGGDQDVGAGATISPPGANGIADGVAYIDGKDKWEFAFDLTTGALLWDYNMYANTLVKTNSVSCAALVGNQLIVAYSDYVFDFNATTGAVIWRSSTAVAEILASVSISGAPGDQVVILGDLGGSEHAYALSDGTLLWSHTVGGKIHSSAAVEDGIVVFGDDNGNLFAFG